LDAFGLLTSGLGAAKSIVAAADEIAQESIRLTDAEEVQLGAQLHVQLSSVLAMESAGARAQRLRQLAMPILQQRARAEIEYQFAIVQDPAFNAFALPGGYVYVYDGVFDRVESDVELEFVLAHEIAHVDLGHCARRMTYSVRAGEIGGEVGGAVALQLAGVIGCAYSQDQEYAADEWAYRCLRRIGRGQQAIIGAFRHLSEPVSVEDKAQDFIAILSQHLASHPATASRIQRLQDLEPDVPADR